MHHSLSIKREKLLAITDIVRIHADEMLTDIKKSTNLHVSHGCAVSVMETNFLSYFSPWKSDAAGDD